MEPGRPIVVVPHVVFARPDDLHGRADRLRDVRGFRRVVRRQPPPEAAADARHLNRHRLARDAEHAGDDLRTRTSASAAARRSRSGHRARARCSSAARASRARETAPRRSRRPSCAPRSNARATSPWSPSTLPGFAASARNCADSDALDSSRPSPSSHVTRSASRPFIAAHVESATTATPGFSHVGFLCPSIVTTRLHAGHGKRRRRIDACGTAAVDRTLLDDRVEHARACARRDRRSARRRRSSAYRRRGSALPTIVWRLDVLERRRILRDGQRRGRSREIAVGRRAARRAMVHDAAGGFAGRRIDAPLLRRGGDQQQPRDRAGALAERAIRRSCRRCRLRPGRRTTRDSARPARRARDRPFDVELLGDHHRQASS